METCRKNSIWLKLVLILKIFSALTHNILAAEVTVATSGYNHIYTDYNVKESSSVVLQIKGPKDAQIGLLADVKSTFRGQPFYEFFIGGYSNSRIGLRRKGDTHAALMTFVYQPAGLSTTSFTSIWLTWEDHKFSLGRGSEIGKNVILNYNDTEAPMQINYLALSSWGSLSHTWKYYNVQPVTPNLGPTCSPVLANLLNNTVTESLNDNNENSCINFTTSLSNIHLPLVIHKKQYPIDIKIKLKSVPSCLRSHIVVFSGSSKECLLTSDTSENGTVSCVYSCRDHCSSLVTIGFLLTYDRAPEWSVCEVVPL